MPQHCSSILPHVCILVSLMVLRYPTFACWGGGAGLPQGVESRLIEHLGALHRGNGFGFGEGGLHAPTSTHTPLRPLSICNIQHQPSTVGSQTIVLHRKWCVFLTFSGQAPPRWD